jgi:IclR family transcriptional regulator, KDG regulon repressor
VKRRTIFSERDAKKGLTSWGGYVNVCSTKHCFIPEMSDRYIIPSLDRAFQVLTTLAEERRGMPLAELGRVSGIPKSSLFRILVTLQHNRCVVWNQEEKAYQLGSRLSELGNSFLEQYDLYDASGRHMKALAEACKETVFLGRLEEGQVIYVRRMYSPHSATVVKKLGQRFPVHRTATGVALLAYLPEREVDDILARQAVNNGKPLSEAERVALKRSFVKVRDQQFAVVGGEHDDEVTCVSSPIFDHSKRPRASLTAAMVARSRNRAERVDAVSVMVREAAQSFSKELGFGGAVDSN